MYHSSKMDNMQERDHNHHIEIIWKNCRMSRKKHASLVQYRRLRQFVIENPDIGMNQGRQIPQNRWEKIAETLNSLPGPKKTFQEWRKAFYGQRRYIGKKKSKPELKDKNSEYIDRIPSLKTEQNEDIPSTAEIKEEIDDHPTEESPWLFDLKKNVLVIQYGDIISSESNNQNDKIEIKSSTDILNHCRLCLKPYANRNIEDKIDEVNTIWERVNSLVEIQIHPSDGLPNKVCAVCFAQLNASLKFISKCKETDKKLQSLYIENNKENNFNEPLMKNFNNSQDEIINKELDIKIEETRINDNSDNCQDFYQNNEHDYAQNESTKKETNKKKNGEVKIKKKIVRPIAQCSICGKILSCRYVLKQHMRAHTGETPFGCDLCGKKLINKTSLEGHIRIHTGENPYTCEICGVTFRHQKSLTRHLISHTGVKPYACTICEKKYTTMSHMKYHMKYKHNKHEKIFKCSKCKYSSVSFRELKRHLRKVHSERNRATCNLCGKVLRPESMKRHMMLHTGEKPYECEHCPVKFIQKSDMVKHQQRHMKKNK